MKKEQVELLKECWQEWLQIHDLDYDFWFYTAAEWRARGETILTDADGVLAFDNSLVNIFNYTGPWTIEEDLQDLTRSFGYYFEFGNHWNLGFYALENLPALPPMSTPYSDLLADERWQAKRKRIAKRSQGICETCGARAEDVHHCYYRYGRLPWQYPDESLLHLCRKCHDARGREELKFRGFLPKIHTHELVILRKAIDKGLYWYPRQEFWNFVATLGADPDQCAVKLKDLAQLRSHKEEREEKA